MACSVKSIVPIQDPCGIHYYFIRTHVIGALSLDLLTKKSTANTCSTSDENVHCYSAAYVSLASKS